MECNAQRAVAETGADEFPCPTRRGIISGLATIVATTGLSRVTLTEAHYDATLIYFHAEFMKAASRMAAAEGKLQQTLYRRMMALATAVSVTPIATPRARQARREIADWSFDQGPFTLRLPFDLVAALSTEDRP
ncbi:hypothetical protein [Rhizobium leucaenae]|uniref:hypothetical protein n=1 Tax=Rhizobium leucaenae TaxID=29450 RepID=UPI0007EE6505|nr:hypothetical protein [Rhizobium leucaenae]